MILSMELSTAIVHGRGKVLAPRAPVQNDWLPGASRLIRTLPVRTSYIHLHDAPLAKSHIHNAVGGDSMLLCRVLWPPFEFEAFLLSLAWLRSPDRPLGPS